MKHYQMYIDGQWCDASDGTILESVNPATGEVWATAAVAGEAEVNRAVAAADRALKTGPWAEMNATQRGKLLRRLGDLIAENSQMLGEIETIDSGKLGKETTVLPAASAGPSLVAVKNICAFQGTTAATTPIGTRLV